MHSHEVTEVSYDDYCCPNGQSNCAGKDAIDDEYKFFRCRDCFKDIRSIATKNGVVNPFYVVVYNVGRHYGGPEEGGWWYDSTSILEVRKVWNWKSALKAMRELKEDYPQPRYNRFSVLGNQGDYFIGMYYDVEQFPKESTGRPRYE